jgi:hypothetical protein
MCGPVPDALGISFEPNTKIPADKELPFQWEVHVRQAIKGQHRLNLPYPDACNLKCC